MPSAAALRLQIETALGTRIPGALTPRPSILRNLAATGIPELDTLLAGGLPIGAITELVGPQSSGRTTLALATLAELTQSGKTVAWIDVADTLDPESAAAAGVDLERQLWVRCGQNPAIPSAATALNQKGTTSPAFLVESNRTPAPSRGCGSPHPRSEARGLSQAVDALLQPDAFARTLAPRHHGNQSRKDRTIGTPGAPNRKLLDRTPQDPRPIPRRAQDRKEQIPTDRQPTRRQILHACSEPANKERSLGAAQIINTAAAANNRPHPGHWSDNSNNAHGRAFHTPPNAIAAGLPLFRDLEARSTGFSPNPVTRVLPVPGEPGLAGPHIMPQSLASNKPKRKQANNPSLAGDCPANLPKTASPLWTALDQSLRATDLLLSAGGFSAIVLDLGSTPPEFAWRIPLATWFRFRAAADRARTVLLVLTQHPCARSSAELVLRLTPAQPQSATTVLTAAHFRVTLDRRRFDSHLQPTSHPEPSTPTKLHLVPTRKPPQREASWHRAATWTGMQPGVHTGATGTHPRGTP